MPATHPLSTARRRANLTQTELGELATISRETVSRIERGELPHLRTARAIAGVLGIALEAIFPPETSEAPAAIPGLREDTARPGRYAAG